MSARLLAAILLPSLALAQTATVAATGATAAYPTDAGNEASASVWPHPSDPSRSVLVVADPSAGLLALPLDGGAPAQLSGGSWAGVSVREQFPLAGARVTLLAASQRDAGVVRLFTLSEGLSLQHRGEITPTSASGLSGTALDFNPSTLEASVFLSRTSPFAVEQHLLTDLQDGGLSGAPVRTLTQGSAASNLAVDVENGVLFVAEDALGVRAYDADPFGGTSGTLLATVTAPFGAPIGGLALYPSSLDEGYLLVGDPSGDRFHLLEKEGAFTQIGPVEIRETDSAQVSQSPNAIAVFNRPAGGFDAGVLAIEDRDPVAARSRFLLVPWQDVAGAFQPPLAVDPDIQPGAPDGGASDGGTDAGVAGGGPGTEPGGPAPSGVPPDDAPTGCGCAHAPASTLLLLGGLAGLLRGRRRES